MRYPTCMLQAGYRIRSSLQRMQSSVARVILLIPMSSDITTHLKSLHWLLVKVGSSYEIACICYRSHKNTAPSFVTDMLQKIHCTPATRAVSHTPCLFSTDLHTAWQHCDRSIFLYIYVLNTIPSDIRCASSLS